MLEDDVGAGAGGLHVAVVVVPDVDARLVVVAPGAHVVARIHLGETLAQVEAVAVDPEFVHPIVHHVLAVSTREGTFMVKVVAHVEGVRGGAVEPRTVGGRVAVVEIHLHHGVLAAGVVQHHVEHHGDAAAVGLVDEGLEGVLGSVVFIECEVKARIVAPAIVALKLVHRHELDAVHAQALNVAQGVAQGLVVVAGNKVAQVQLVHHQVRFGRPHEVVHLPLVSRLVGLQGGHDAGLAGRVGAQVGVGHGRDKPVVIGVEHLFGVGVGHAQRAIHQVLVGVFLAGGEAVELHPPRVAVGGFVHKARAGCLKIIELAHRVHELLVGSREGQHNRRATRQISHALVGTGGQGRHRHRGPDDENHRV